MDYGVPSNHIKHLFPHRNDLLSGLIKIQIVFGRAFSLLIVLQGCVSIWLFIVQHWLYLAVR